MGENDTINVLIIDDEELIRDGYKAILMASKPEEVSFNFDIAEDCDIAWGKLAPSKYDLVFLDLSFPIKEGSQFNSGEELGIKIREEYPQTKILVITGGEKTFQLNKIVEEINPEGFILKGETNSREIARCVESILEGGMYQSKKITKLLRVWVKNMDILDETDHRILYYISLGTSTKDLPNYIPLALRTLEERKRKLKDFFEAKNNEELLRKAREAGHL